MVASKKYYFEIANNKIIGYHSYEMQSEGLPEGHLMVPFETNNDPNLYLGLDAKDLTAPNPPFPPPAPPIINVRAKLRGIYFELKFTEDLGEDTTTLQVQYDALKIEYDNLKATP